MNGYVVGASLFTEADVYSGKKLMRNELVEEIRALAMKNVNKRLTADFQNEVDSQQLQLFSLPPHGAFSGEDKRNDSGGEDDKKQGIDFINSPDEKTKPIKEPI